MYPNLLGPLLTMAGLLLAAVVFIVVRQPVSRRLALRQVSRRRSEAVLAMLGATLGTSIIVGALVVGDTLNFSVRQDAYRTLGPIDERVTSANAQAGETIGNRLDSLRSNPDVDGVLNARVAQAAAVAGNPTQLTAEPRVLAWDMNWGEATSFGAAGGPSGISGPAPQSDQVVINKPLADSLRARTGDDIHLYLYGSVYRLHVIRVLPERGLAGVGLGATVNRDAFLPQGLLDAAAAAANNSPVGVTFVSNRGGVETGARLTTQVTAAIRTTLGASARTVLVETPKRNDLDSAKQTGDALGALFLMIGSFSIIAGALLLVNIFVMLAEERKAQLGMLRAIGMRRSTLVGALTVEGSTYALGAIVPGVLLGLGVGWGVAQVAAQIFSSFSANGDGLAISFAVTPTSIVNASALGLVIALATIIITSVRISRFNVIAAIRDLPSAPTARARRVLTAVATGFAILLGVAALPAVARSQPEASYLLPSLAAALAVPLLRRWLGPRVAVTSAAGGVLAWCLLVPLLRPHLYDNASMAVFVISGTLVAFSAVILVSQNQDVLLQPLRRAVARSRENGLALHLAVAYPLAKRFRTGATLVMYALITLVLVLLVEVAGVINASIDQNVADATAGYAMRLDFNAAAANDTVAGLRSAALSDRIAAVTPLLSAPALSTDPGHRTKEPLRTLVVGVPDGSMSAMRFSDRIAGATTDGAVWALVARDPRYVVMDQFFGATGGPNGSYYSPGDSFTLTDPRTGLREQKIIAGILINAQIFYPVNGQSGAAYPVIGSAEAVRSTFGKAAELTGALIRTRPGVDPQRLASELQSAYLSSSLVATPMAASVRRMFAANVAFFRLMQGFLALGLAVGITGLGVVMVRAVRERRRTIGVLRALGFASRTVQRSFLMESAIVAAEGVVLGSVLGLLTTWLMYQKAAMFDGVRVRFPIEWPIVSVLVAVTVALSLAATWLPARNAARIRPAVAVRIAD